MIYTRETAARQYRMLMNASKLVGESKANILVAQDLRIVLDGKLPIDAVIDSTHFLAKEAYRDARENIRIAEGAMNIFGQVTDTVYMNMVEANMYRGAGEAYERRIKGLTNCAENTTRLTKYGLLVAKYARTLLNRSLDLTKQIDPGTEVNLHDYHIALDEIEEVIEDYAMRLGVPYASTEAERHTSISPIKVREAGEEGREASKA